MGKWFSILMCLLLVAVCIAVGCTGKQVPEKSTEPRTTPATPGITQSPIITQFPEMTLNAATLLVATCNQQNGDIVKVGQSCTGNYIPASDSFSCCSKKPISARVKNITISLDPFDFSIPMNDTLGNITGE
jgi:hypothetical protein